MIQEKTGANYHLVLLRHGRSLGNENGFLQGQQDVPLTDEGRNQARLLAERWFEDQVHFDLVITSPLSRAKETADIIVNRLGCPIVAEPLLMERNVGSLAGAKVDRHEQLIDQDLIASPYRSFSGDGEGDWQLFLRAGQVINNLMQHDPGSYLLVAHGGIINQMIHAILGIPVSARHKGVGFKMDNTGYSHFVYDMDSHHWDVISINNIDHLRRKSSQADE
ncbi:MAG: histidine phosphatase family protein [Anaerolineaceae bacterium]|nr:histidine phosphatase family protein [Anaerolineaceae bacterium]MBN2676478.1 histidine phosphatase family protein [Anaerolineaceae bacterium]